MNFTILAEQPAQTHAKHLISFNKKEDISVGVHPNVMHMTAVDADTYVRCYFAIRSTEDTMSDPFTISHATAAYIQSKIGEDIEIERQGLVLRVKTKNSTQKFAVTETEVLTMGDDDKPLSGLTFEDIETLKSLLIVKDSPLGVIFDGNDAIVTDSIRVAHKTFGDNVRSFEALEFPPKLFELGAKFKSDDYDLFSDGTNASLSSSHCLIQVPLGETSSETSTKYIADLVAYIARSNINRITVDRKALMEALAATGLVQEHEEDTDQAPLVTLQTIEGNLELSVASGGTEKIGEVAGTWEEPVVPYHSALHRLLFQAKGKTVELAVAGTNPNDELIVITCEDGRTLSTTLRAS